MKTSTKGCLFYLFVLLAIFLAIYWGIKYYSWVGVFEDTERYAYFNHDFIGVNLTDTVIKGSDDRNLGVAAIRFHKGDSIYPFKMTLQGVIVWNAKEYVGGTSDNPFILVVQKPKKGLYYPIKESPIGLLGNGQRAERFDPNYKYWIIKYDTDDVYGPFTEEEYFLKRKELGVGEELKLRFEKRWWQW